MSQLWEHLLGIERVGIQDDFFELGGHSLLATQMISRLREAVGIELPLRVVFDTRTVAALAERIQVIQWGVAASEADHSTPDREEIEL